MHKYSKNPVSTQINSQRGTPVVYNSQTQTLSQQKLSLYSSVFLFLESLFKSNKSHKIKFSFVRIKKVSSAKKKHSEILSKKLDFLFSRKKRQHIKESFSSILSNNISKLNELSATHRSQVLFYRQKSSGALFYILRKIYKRRICASLENLKSKSKLLIQHKVYKSIHMTNILSRLTKNRMRLSFGKISATQFIQSLKEKRLIKLERFIREKEKNNINSAFIYLRLFTHKQKSKQAKELEIESRTEKIEKITRSITPGQKQLPINKTTSSTIPTIPANKQFNKQQNALNQQTKKKLELQKTDIQLQLKRLSHINVQTLQTKLKQLQAQKQSIKSNNEVLEQSNVQLEHTLQQKQSMAWKTRTKKLNENQIWENIYSNFIYVLAINSGRHNIGTVNTVDNVVITKSKLLQCLQTPLAPCNSIMDLEQLKEENLVLEELLNEYKKSFPVSRRSQLQTEKDENQLLLPYDILKKKNRYYYAVLEELQELGAGNKQQLKKLHQNLETLQNKLSNQQQL